MEVRTRVMTGNWDRTRKPDGTEVLWLRDGMLPRKVVYELGAILAALDTMPGSHLPDVTSLKDLSAEG